MRYNDQLHLDRFKRGVFPQIHEAMFGYVREHAEGRRFLDLGCCFGLLGQHLRRAVPESHAIGIDASPKQVEQARENGVTIPLYAMKVDESTLPKVVDLIHEHAIDTIVARRSLCVVFVKAVGAGYERNDTFARSFCAAVSRAGVREFFAQGMAPDPRATAPIHRIEHEIDILAPDFRLIEKRGQCAYLKARAPALA
jgi:SAM-dependent methyltransferase